MVGALRSVATTPVPAAAIRRGKNPKQDPRSTTREPTSSELRMLVHRGERGDF